MPFDAQTIASALRASASQFPDKICFCSDETALTYAEAENRISRLAAKFRKMGVSVGDRIALLDTDSVKYLIAFYALAAIGAIVVPLNYRLREPELQYQLSHSKVCLLLAGRRYADAAGNLAHDLRYGWRNLASFVAESDQSSIDTVATSQDISEWNSASAFAICYTSGTTGRPKGAVLSHRSAYIRGLKFIVEFKLQHSDVFHLTSPMFHIASINLSFTAILRGASIAIRPQFDLAHTPQFVRERGVTFLLVVPTILAMMVEMPDFGPDYFGQVRLIMYTAAPMNVVLLRKIMEVYKGDFVQSFGQTEDLPQAILDAADHRALFAIESPRLSSVGRPAVGVELKICDDSGKPVERGSIGEIVTRGGTEMSCYLDNPTETGRTLRDGWIFSGDLGYQDNDGYVFLSGRKKHLIIRGGENIYPVEVERVLLEYAGVQDAAVIGVPDEKWGERVVAVIAVNPKACDIVQLQSYLRSSLAAYKCPDKIFVADALPYNATGKVDRAALHAKYVNMT